MIIRRTILRSFLRKEKRKMEMKKRPLTTVWRIWRYTIFSLMSSILSAEILTQILTCHQEHTIFTIKRGFIFCSKQLFLTLPQQMTVIILTLTFRNTKLTATKHYLEELPLATDQIFRHYAIFVPFFIYFKYPSFLSYVWGHINESTLNSECLFLLYCCRRTSEWGGISKFRYIPKQFLVTFNN